MLRLSLNETAPSVLRQNEEPSIESPKPTAPGLTKPPTSRWFNRFQWIAFSIALAAVASLASWGILFSLRTPEGTLIVESEVEDVRLELVDQGQQVTQLQIEPGASETTLRAGKYRVRLAAGSDRIDINPREFTLRRGAQVVAKLRFVPKADDANPLDADRLSENTLENPLGDLAENTQAGNPLGAPVRTQPALAKNKIPTEPVYDGKTFAEWNALMQYEQVLEKRYDAAIGVASLIHTRPAEEQAGLAIEAVRRTTSQPVPEWMSPASLAAYGNPTPWIPPR